MSSQAKAVFDAHVTECREAISIYVHLETHAGFSSKFNLRFVWIAAVSALDHYVSQIILERATHAFGNRLPLQDKLLADVMSFASALEFKAADPVTSVLVFRGILDKVIRTKTFQRPDKISDGLSYIWPEPHKWQHIASRMGSNIEVTKKKLSAIVDRRNVMVHAGDFDEALRRKLNISKEDAEDVVGFVERLVCIIDEAVGR